MLKLDGKTLPYDRAFTHNGYQYPANWLRHATLAQKQAIGITEVADPPWFDQRFYWGAGNPKDLAELKKNWIDIQKATAGSLLSKSDWMIIRYSEATTAIPSSTTTYRTAVRTQCKAREDQITACTTTDELAALIGNGQRAGSATNGATEKFDTSKEVKDSEGNSYDPKRYESFDPKQYNDIVLEAWPTE